MSIRKAIIPAAGLGTRMLPAAKAVPKEMLPILDRPAIQLVAEEAVAAGIDDLLLITAGRKRAIEDHFDRDGELERRLDADGKRSLLQSLDALAGKVQVHAVRQPEQRGLGDAVMQARRHVGRDPFLCQLGDAVFSRATPGPLPAQQLIDAWREHQCTIIGVEVVPTEKVSRYGIVGGREIAPGVLRLDTLVEKPRPEAAPSNYAIAARYVLTPGIFDCLEVTGAGAGGEIQLTDALRLLLQREPVYAVVLSARRHDIGNSLDWLKTNLTYAAQNPTLWSQLAPFLKQLLG